MSTLIYHVAMSLDGFIADHAGGVGWLPAPAADGEDFGFGAFYDQLGAVIMGSRTYLQSLDLSADWPYPRLRCVVMTRQALTHERSGDVEFSAADPSRVLSDLRARVAGKIWLVGGAALAASFAAANLIDEYDIALMPVLLGAGVPLRAIHGASVVQRLVLVDQHGYSGGVLRLRYHVD